MKSFLNVIALGLLVLVGCSSEDPKSEGKAQESTRESAGLPESVFLARTPDGAKPLSEVKGKAKDGDEVKFTARIGGRKKPFVEGRAVMVVIDPALPSCADNADDACPVPWDYCCETQEDLAANTATVQFVDDGGKPLSVSLKGQRGLKELDWVTVVGIVEKTETGGLFVVNATGLFVNKEG